LQRKRASPTPSGVVAVFAPLDGLPLGCIPSERATLMLSMSLYVLGPVAAFVLASIVYLIERGPIIGSRWIDFLRNLRDLRDGR
jgi:hypothetical protein